MKAVSLKLVMALLLVVLALSSFSQEVQWEGMAPMPVGGMWTQNSTVVVNCKAYTVGFNSGGDAIDRFFVFDPTVGTRGQWTELAPMQVAGQYPTYLASAAYVNGKIYVMGGRDVANGVPVNFTRVYDIATDSWSKGTDMPISVRGHAAGVYNNKIYVFGGNTGTYQNTVRIYDPVADTWTTGANMPNPVGYGSVAFNSNDNKFYYFGGDNGAGTYYGTCWIYDPAANSWSNTGSAMVQAIDQAGWAMDTVNNRIYVFSGVDGAGIWNVCQYYDITLNTWSSFAFMPIAQYRQGAWAFYDSCDGYVYVGGGYAGADLSNVLRYDPATDAYPGLRMQPDWNYSQQGGPVSGVVGGKMYFLEGDGTFDGQVYMYDPATGPGTDSWTLMTGHDPDPKAYGVGGTYNNEIFYASGADSSFTEDPIISKYTPASDTWDSTSYAAIPTPRFYTGGCQIGSMLYVFGGENASGLLNNAEAYDMATDTWSSLSPMPTAREGMACAATNGKIYLFGGWDNVSPNSISDEVIEYDPATDSYSLVTNIPNSDPTNSTVPAYSFAVAHNGFIYVFYGLYYYITGGAYYSSSDVNIYHPASNTWYYSAGVTWRAWCTVALSQDFIGIFGGVDVGGGVFEPSADFGTLVDDAFPTVAITNPIADQILTGSPVTINATATDDHGIANVDFYYSTVSGGSRTLISTDTTASYSASWDISAFANGTFFLTADATDTNSQTVTSAEVRVVVNTTGDAVPTVTVSSPLANQVVIGDINLSAIAVDNIGITDVEFFIDGNSVGSTSTHTGTTYSLPWDSASVSNGAHFIQAKATDTIGQRTTSATVQFSTNNTDDPPTVDLTEPVAGTVHAMVSLAATASDDHGVTKVDFYAGTTLISSDNSSPYTAEYDTAGMNGAITFKAVATDTKGQTTEDTVATTADNPHIDTATKKGNPFRIIVMGSNFKSGCIIKVDGVTQGTTKYKSSTKLVLKGYKPAKGVPVTITVENTDGGVSNGVIFTR